MRLPIRGCVLACLVCAAGAEEASVKWKLGDPILSRGPKGSFDEVSVKDPSIVFFEDRWHLFYTARNATEYTAGYVSAKELADLKSTPRHIRRAR